MVKRSITTRRQKSKPTSGLGKALLNGSNHKPSKQRLSNLEGLLGMLEPVPEEWLKPPEEKDEETPNSLIYLIVLTPPALGEAAYHGFLGEYMRAVAPYTEATDACVLGHLIPAISMVIGPRPHVHGGNAQPCRFNTAIVGPTSTGRKGTGFVPVDLLMKRLDFDFWDNQQVRGLSSGEGLIQKVSDQRVKDDDGKTKVVLVEKRLYVVESEFSKVLAHVRREGNILSQIMREAYDSGNLGVLTRNPLHATNAHICITGHITPEELQKRFSQVEMANGFGNRFLWFAVKSDKELPCAEPIPEKTVKKFSKRLAGILRFTSKQNRLKFDDDALEDWEYVYSSLRKDRPGFAGALTARGESVVLRLALLYALLDKSKDIRADHLRAALAVWKYNEESVAALFKNKSGSELADKLYRLLGGGAMKTTEFHSHMNVTSDELKEALGTLEYNGLIEQTQLKQKKGPGRPAVRWARVDP